MSAINTDKKKPVVRSSSMPLLMVCTNAILNPDGLQPVEQENETALLGTLVHALAQGVVDTGAYDLPALKQRLNDEDFERASMLFHNFLAVWREAQPYMPTPQTEVGFEVELSHVVLTGHIDTLQLDALRAFILDYKTGRMHEDHYHQMAAYATGAWDKAGRPDNYTVYVTTVYLEDNSVTHYTFTADDLKAWEREVAAQVMQLRYTAGRKCSHCTLQGGCPAYRAWGQGAVGLFREDAAVPMATWEQMTPEERGDLVDKMYVVEKAIDRVKLGLRNLVKRDGAVDVGGGKEYVLIEQEEKQVIPDKALPILLKRLGKSGVVRNTRLPLDAVLTEFASKAARGQKTNARKELLAELDKAGAIVRSKTTKMWRRPKGEQVLDTGGVQ